jgi:TatD DNase family protein
MPGPMIDTHCHLDVPAFAEDVGAVVARATAAGVIGMLVPAIRPAMWPALAALVERHRSAGLRLAIGVHPQIVPELAPDEIGGIERDRGIGRDGDIDAIAAWIAREAIAYGAVAIGECGLDGATADMPRQEALFRAHSRAARIPGLPLVIHVLRAHDLAPRVLRDELARWSSVQQTGPSPFSAVRPADTNGERIVGVMHSYSGGADLAEVYRELGLAFSFAGPVSYANARKPVEAARAIPADLLLAETDAPDQAPEGHRGGRSEPAFVAAVIAGLAAARGVTAEEIAALTTANAKRIFQTWDAE